MRILTRCMLAATLALSLNVTAAIRLETITTQVSAPVDLVSAKDGTTLYVVEQGGTIRRLVGKQIETTPFLDIRNLTTGTGERGLLGLALHPKYTSNGYLYVNYTRRSDGATMISRFTRSTADPREADPATEKVILTVAQPYANHNGGGLRFGPDGYLYIGMGDGGSGNDPQNYAQNNGSLLGKMLRIDVDRGDPYMSPNDNPFAPSPAIGRSEIFASGLRNPWRFSFDHVEGGLFIGDVGQSAKEEINFLGPVITLQFPRALINFGWRTLEGTRCTGLDGINACDTPNAFVPPILEYDHTGGNCSVTGGVRYTGRAVPELATGYNYVYGDYCTGQIWRGTRDAAGKWTSTTLVNTGGNITAFGEDDAGEVYVLDSKKGVLKITSDTIGTPAPQTVVEYFNTTLNHYFMSSDTTEQRSVESGGAGPGWERTGQTFTVVSAKFAVDPRPPPGSGFPVGVCRFYGRPGVGPNSHFYTAEPAECASVRKDNGWLYEGLAFQVWPLQSNGSCPGSYRPVYRSYNQRFAQNDSNHRYTIDPAVQQSMVAKGWADEGVRFCVAVP
jgi:hypothetical protein